MDSIDSAINATIAAKSAATQQEIAFAILAKSQAAAKAQGDAAVELLEATANLGKAISKGQQFDAVA
jgi:hypothetical protein